MPRPARRMRPFIAKAKGYISRNLGAPFILAFDLLILTTALAVVYGDPLANHLALAAYCLAALGVILQALSFLKEGSQRATPSKERAPEGP